jgi:hypothetical protein
MAYNDNSFFVLLTNTRHTHTYIYTSIIALHFFKCLLQKRYPVLNEGSRAIVVLLLYQFSLLCPPDYYYVSQ